jgi:hypothetical protein
MFFTPPLVGLIFSPAIQAGEGGKKMKKILEFFSPYPAWVVGGCVRDLLLGKVPKDIDIVVQAPGEVLEQLGGVPVDPQTRLRQLIRITFLTFLNSLVAFFYKVIEFFSLP